MNPVPALTVDARVLTDMDRCIECGSCAAACSVSHGHMPIVNAARSGRALLPVICRQCRSAACVAVCPAEAMVCDDRGVVRRRPMRCIGCGSCAKACPFGVLPNALGGAPGGFRSPDRISGYQIAKCDLCEDRLAQHASAVPRCVAACPAGALVFADPREAEKEGLALLGGRTIGESPFKRR